MRYSPAKERLISTHCDLIIIDMRMCVAARENLPKRVHHVDIFRCPSFGLEFGTLLGLPLRHRINTTE